MQDDNTTGQEWKANDEAVEADGYYGDEGGDSEVDLSFLDDQKPQE